MEKEDPSHTFTMFTMFTMSLSSGIIYSAFSKDLKEFG